MICYEPYNVFVADNESYEETSAVCMGQPGGEVDCTVIFYGVVHKN